MNVSNFEFLRSRRPELLGLAVLAESYVFTDAASAAIKLRTFAETVVKSIYTASKLPTAFRATFVDLLENSAFQSITPTVIRDKLHAIRREGNKAAHGDAVTAQSVVWILREAHDLARWMVVNFEKIHPATLPTFQSPQPPQATTVQTKKALENLAIQEAQMVSLLEELEKAREKLSLSEVRISELELKALKTSASTAVDVLGFDEATTRKHIIDRMIASAGWNVADALKSTTEVAKEFEVHGQPTPRACRQLGILKSAEA